MCCKPTQLNSTVTRRAILVPSLSLAIASQFLLIPLSILRVEASETSFLNNSQSAIATNFLAQNNYFPRRGELKRCFVTQPDTCIFRDHYYVQVVPALDLSLEYRKANFLAEVAAKFAAAKDYKRAALIARSISLPVAKAAALSAVAAEYGSSEQTATAQQLLFESVQIAQTKDIGIRNLVLTHVAIGYAAIGQQTQAAQILEQVIQDAQNHAQNLKQPFVIGNLLRDTVALLAAAGQTAQAEQILREIPIEQVDSIFQPLVRLDQYEFAVHVANKLPNSAKRNQWLLFICSHLADSGEYDRAVELALSLNNEALLSSLSRQARFLDAPNKAVKLAQSGNLADALSIVELIELPYYKASTLTEIAIKLADTGQAEQSKQTLIKAIQIAENLENPTVGNAGDGGGLVSVAIRLAETGRIREALSITETISDESYKVLVMINIADLYIKSGQTARALEMLSKILDMVTSLRCSRCAK
jgi:tetratricopeptide (TPR) repeat protein